MGVSKFCPVTQLTLTHTANPEHPTCEADAVVGQLHTMITIWKHISSVLKHDLVYSFWWRLVASYENES